MEPVLVSFVVYTTAIVTLGTYIARFAKRSASDLFLAGRGLGAWVASLSSSAPAEISEKGSGLSKSLSQPHCIHFLGHANFLELIILYCG